MKPSFRDKGPGGWKGTKRSGGSSPWKRSFGDRDSARTTMHRATCSKCNKECEVPFRPNGKKPIFCSQCFKRDDYSDTRPSGGASFRKPSFDEKRTQSVDYAEQFKLINAKLDVIIEAMSDESEE